MATITKRKTSKGEVRYRVQVRIKQDGKVVHSESRTFANLATARGWARDREVLLADPAELAKVTHRGVSVRELIDRYLAEVSGLRPMGRSKDSALRALRNTDLADLNALTLTQHQVLNHLSSRRRVVGPATAMNDLIWLRASLEYARRVHGVPINTLALEDAAATAKDMRIVARPKKRNRRPTSDELRHLTEYFRARRSKIPMDLVMWLAIYSARRLAELFSIQHSDLHPGAGTYLVRDVKHPDGSAGNHKMAVLPAPGWEVVKAIEMKGVVGDRLLPFERRTAGSLFTRACQMLGIVDLRFHDLRHEGCSRLAEDGLTIPQIQQVSLHDSWSSLQRYVQVTRQDRVDWVDL